MKSKMSLEQARKIAADANKPALKEAIKDQFMKFFLAAIIIISIGGIIL